MPASPSDARQKWRKTKVGPKSTKRPRPEEFEDDDNDDDNNNNDIRIEPDEDEDLHPNPNPNPKPNTNEVVPGSGVRISGFPPAVRFVVNRAHPSVMGGGGVVENVSYGQLQALSAVPADMDAAAVIAPPVIIQGRGVVKSFWNRVHVVPLHADWFQPNTVHRLERQVVPHFFSGKSPKHTPDKYLDSRNFIVAKYIQNPHQTLSLSDTQPCPVAVDYDDLSRIFRFLDHWGIINYSASLLPEKAWTIDSYLREDPNGEVHVPSAKLKSIDSLIKFDKPKCRLKPCDLQSSLPFYPDDLDDLDNKIRERLSETHCSHCSRPLLIFYYQSVKEADTLMCPDCFHEGRLVIGHSSMDFVKVDSTSEYADQDGDSWTDQETLLLLEAVEIYNDNWNDIAEHVGSKSKAQCILHFLRLPMEDGLMENIEVPSTSTSSNVLNKNEHGSLYLNANGSHVQDSDSENRFPFANSENPVMALVAFLASAVGPRIAAACAHASLAALSDDDPSSNGNRMDSDEIAVETRNFSQQKEEKSPAQGSGVSNNVNAEASPLSVEKVKSAAKTGLAAAAMKAKLFADHEEREIQRLSANIINHQLKRLELKLKQFAEVETLLMKECEQVEKTRQRLAGERTRALAARFGSSGVASPMNLSGVAPAVVNNNSRPPAMSASPSQPSASGYGNSQMSHPQMPFLQRQQMFSFGPRLPLSAIQPSSSGSSSIMFGAQGSGQSSLNHPVLRPVPGTSSGMG